MSILRKAPGLCLSYQNHNRPLNPYKGSLCQLNRCNHNRKAKLHLQWHRGRTRRVTQRRRHKLPLDIFLRLVRRRYMPSLRHRYHSSSILKLRSPFPVSKTRSSSIRLRCRSNLELDIIYHLPIIRHSHSRSFPVANKVNINSRAILRQSQRRTATMPLPLYRALHMCNK
jgi:hypothetical protein